MDPATIQFKTIEFINGLKYISASQLEILCQLMCVKLGIEKSEENFNHVRNACKTYFETQSVLKQ